MPRGSKLDRLIRFPREIDMFYTRIEQEGRLTEYLQALWELPESSVRDVRIARVWMQQGFFDKAKKLLEPHRRCPLAKSVYMGLLTKGSDEATLRKIADNYRPWSLERIGNSLLNIEARYNDCMTLGALAHALKRTKMAHEMYFEALQSAKLIMNKDAVRGVYFNWAWGRLFDGQLHAAQSTFEEVLKLSQAGQVVHENALEYISWIAWINQEIPEYAPEWMAKALDAAAHGELLDSSIQVPATANIPYILPMLQDLRALTREFNRRLPVMYVQSHRELLDQLASKVIDAAGSESVGEMVGFVTQAMRALALSMQHDTAAIQVLKAGFAWPTTGIPAMAMLYYANLVQIHANLPHAQMDQSEVKQALHLLATQFHNMPGGQQKWLLSWMRDFTPVTCFLLSEQWDSYPPLHNYVVVQPQGVYRGSEGVEKFPRFFMTREVNRLLAGGRPPESNRMQALRAFRVLKDMDEPMVIYQPIVNRFRHLFH